MAHFLTCEKCGAYIITGGLSKRICPVCHEEKFNDANAESIFQKSLHYYIDLVVLTLTPEVCKEIGTSLISSNRLDRAIALQQDQHTQKHIIRMVDAVNSDLIPSEGSFKRASIEELIEEQEKALKAYTVSSDKKQIAASLHHLLQRFDKEIHIRASEVRRQQ